LKTKLLQSLSAYKELIQTGGIQSTAEGENVFLEIKGNLAGDILVFIGPINKNVSALTDIYELIQSDRTLEEQRDSAFKILRKKYRGLSLLPSSLVWSINIVISVLYAYLNSSRMRELFCGEISLAEIQALLPIVSTTAVTYFLIKVYGLKILKPFLFLVVKVIRFFRMVQNRKIE
jgi:hypothetical protein